MKKLLALAMMVCAFMSCTSKEDSPIQEVVKPLSNPVTSYLPYDRILKTPMDQYYDKVFEGTEGSLNYRMLFPKNYDPAKQYPLIVVLHGLGERGNDNQRQLSNGGAFFLEDGFRNQHQAIVVFPQCPTSTRWDSKVAGKDKLKWFWKYKEEPTPYLSLVMKLVNDLQAKKVVDTKQMYAMGISSGAMGTYELCYRMPKTFAAAVVMSGGGNPQDIVDHCSKMAFRIMHGDADGVVDISYANHMVQAMKDAKMEVKQDVFPGIGHGPWNDPMFTTPGLMDWLFSHHK
ncbi:alpha/beta hydrolase-fold protein [Persicobacter psychrovividus]|uniref:Phospholipase n=1 Tax=Persicobacter psychrovividus TaxID=387638 RepID=A0ABM7VI47_9BACT|nr:phospholipase [Persicobacter psychrovividus]